MQRMLTRKIPRKGFGSFVLSALTIGLHLLISDVQAEEKPLKIGVLLPLTGDFAFFGEQAKQGIELALTELNKEKKQVEVHFEDDRCLPKDAVTAMKKLLTVDKVDYVLGPACTGGIIAAAKEAASAKKYMLALLDTNRPVAASGPFTYALGYSSEEEAEIVADYMFNKSIRKVGVIYEDDSWAVNVKDAFVARFTSLGGSITSIESQLVLNASTAPDYKGVISKVAQRKPDALYVVPAYNGGLFLKQFRNLGMKLPVFGPDTFAINEVLEIAGEAAEGTICANAIVEEESESARKLKQRLKEKYGKLPSSIFYPALGYDGLNILVRANASGKPFPDAMSELRYESGVISVSGFDKNRLSKLKPGLFIVQKKELKRLETK